MLRIVLILLTFSFCKGIFAQAPDTAQALKWKIRKTKCLLSYLKKGFIPQEELASINPDCSTCMTDSGRIVSYSLSFQQSPFINQVTDVNDVVATWPDMVKLPKDAIIFVKDIVFRKPDGSVCYFPTLKLIIQ